MNVSQINAGDCSGCGLCAALCAKQAISFDGSGYFRVPTVDGSKCVDCGLCYEKCPHVSFRREDPPRPAGCFASWMNDVTEVGKSSSGGIFFALADSMLKRGGAVCGVVYDEDFRGACHVLTKDPETVQKMRGSKYVPSRAEGVYPEIRNALKNGVPVLFTGTPCQSAALKNFVGDHDLLTCVTLICHGPTSDKVLDRYISDLERAENSRVVSLNMRKKVGKWLPMYIEVGFENGNIRIEPLHKTSFGRIFQSNVLMRESCSRCEYKGFPLIGDIIIGDYKGIEKLGLPFEAMGTSCVILNTEKGRKAFDLIRPSVTVLETEIGPVEAVNQRLVSPVQAPAPDRRRRFEEILEAKGMEAAADFVSPERFFFAKIKSRISKLFR